MIARRSIGHAAIIVLGGFFAAQRLVAASAGGTSIDNAVSAAYSDRDGHAYETSSNQIVVTVASLSNIVVSPKQPAANPAADGVAVASTAVRTFVITNTSNIPDAYQIDKLTAGTLTVGKVAWIGASGLQPTSVNGAASPTVAPGSSISVQVAISTTGLNVGAAVPVQIDAHTTVTGTANGLASDNGEEWLVGTTGPSLSGPGGPNTQVSKTVNETALVQSQPGSVVAFDIVAKNTGGAPATNVVVTDPVPSGLTVDVASATVNGAPAGAQATLSGRTIAFTIPALAGGATVDVAFKASLPPGNTIGESFVNVATIGADGIASQPTTPAGVFAGSANVVFDGYQGGAHPVRGATVSLLDASGTPVRLAAGAVPSVSGLRAQGSATAGLSNPYTDGHRWNLCLRPRAVGNRTGRLPFLSDDRSGRIFESQDCGRPHAVRAQVIL